MTTEYELIEKVKKGDHRAFKELIMRYQKLVVHMIGRVVKVREDVEDLTQEVFVKVYNNLPKFEQKSKLSTWIASIAYRHAINYLEKKRIPLGDIEPENIKIEGYHASDRNLMQEDLQKYVQILIDKLPPQYRLVLVMYHMEDFDYSEIQEITGMPEGTVKNYLFRARKLLKEMISETEKNTYLYG